MFGHAGNNLGRAAGRDLLKAGQHTLLVGGVWKERVRARSPQIVTSNISTSASKRLYQLRPRTVPFFKKAWPAVAEQKMSVRQFRFGNEAERAAPVGRAHAARHKRPLPTHERLFPSNQRLLPSSPRLFPSYKRPLPFHKPLFLSHQRLFLFVY